MTSLKYPLGLYIITGVKWRHWVYLLNVSNVIDVLIKEKVLYVNVHNTNIVIRLSFNKVFPEGFTNKKDIGMSVLEVDDCITCSP